jgi:outer membrane protein insertion porin family
MRIRSLMSTAAWSVIAVAVSAPASFAQTAPTTATSAAPAAAPAAAGETISAVRVEGNQRVESRTIVSYLGMNTSSTFSSQEIDAALKNLYATGFFADIKLLRSGSTLVVRVEENPIISKVVLEGNERLETKDLEKELDLKARSVFSQEKVQADVKRLLDIYRRSGRYNTTIEPKIIKKDQNRVDLVYEISEGATAFVEKITFIGNNAFDNKELKKALRTEETTWYKLFSDSDKYDADRLQFDQELLRRLYVNEGYADFQVKSAHAELSPSKDAFYITFVLDEGAQYKVGDVKVVSELKDVAVPDFSDVMTVKAGKTYDASKVEATIDAMVQRLGDQGYAFVDIQPRLERDPATKTVNLVFTIKPGPRVYVERINVTGNVRTLDEVVRREFRLSEGDAYNSSKLQRSEQRVNNLGYFEKVEVKNEQGSAPDKTVVNVDVKERSTGEVNIGAGYSSTDGALADFGIRERNLLGRGQELKTRLTVAARRNQAELGFTEPYFLQRELAAGFDVYRIAQDFQSESSYDSEIRGFNLRMGYSLQEKLQHQITYSLRDTEISDVQGTASRFIRDQQGQHLNSSLSHALIYDERNNAMDPTRGFMARVTQEVAGLGGDSRYLKHEAKLAYYYPIAQKWTASVMGSGGHVFGFGGRDVRINDRFFLGGDDFRGFRNAGLGPRDITTTDTLGGNSYYVGTAELKFPLGLPEEAGITGAVFTDAGSLWGADDVGPEVFDKASLRVSSGVGVLWSSPFGPIRVDIARAIIDEQPDQNEMFRFSFGTRF